MRIDIMTIFLTIFQDPRANKATVKAATGAKRDAANESTGMISVTYSVISAGVSPLYCSKLVVPLNTQLKPHEFVTSSISSTKD